MIGVFPLVAALCLGTAQVLPRALIKRQNGPVALGTAEDCTWYDDVVNGDYDCAHFESEWGITHEDFVSWVRNLKPLSHKIPPPPQKKRCS